MKTVPLKAGGNVLVTRCGIACSFHSRFLGLMGRRGLPDDQGILFPNCNSIHTMFMRFAIDVVFIHRDGTVLDVVERVLPWRLLFPRRGTKHVLELRAGTCRPLGIVKGLKLDCEGVLD